MDIIDRLLRMKYLPQRLRDAFWRNISIVQLFALPTIIGRLANWGRTQPRVCLQESQQLKKTEAGNRRLTVITSNHQMNQDLDMTVITAAHTSPGPSFSITQAWFLYERSRFCASHDCLSFMFTTWPSKENTFIVISAEKSIVYSKAATVKLKEKKRKRKKVILLSWGRAG